MHVRESTQSLATLRDLCENAARSIESDCRLVLSHISGDNGISTQATTLAGCGSAFVMLLARQAGIVANEYAESVSRSSTGETNITATRAWPAAAPLVHQRLRDILSLTHARFYAYVPAAVPVCWRALYTDASILEFGAQLLDHLHIGDDALNAIAAEGSGPRTPDPAALEGVRGVGGKAGVGVSGMGDPAVFTDRELDDLVGALDSALLLTGGAGSRGAGWIHGALNLLWDAAACDSREPRPLQPLPATFPSARPFVPPCTGRGVPRLGEPPAFEEFQWYLDGVVDAVDWLEDDGKLEGPRPLLIPGLMDDWPAKTLWRSPAYLLGKATFGGRRLVPVEIGRSYTDTGWTQRVVRFRDVVRELVREPALGGKKKNDTVYLAQHALLTQLPSLRADILVPDLCYTSPPPPQEPSSSTTKTASAADAVEDDEDAAVAASPLLNAWLGPAGTITPLHTDAHHNLLCQVVGAKYVRLYPPTTTVLRPRGREAGVDMGNTSSVDVGVVEGWDHVAPESEEVAGSSDADMTDEGRDEEEERRWIEDFKKAEFFDCILDEGMTLYIPRGWWHYVRGLSVSFSVSFWWD